MGTKGGFGMKKEFIFVGVLILVTFALVGIGIASIIGNVSEVDSGHDHSSHSGHGDFGEDSFEGESAVSDFGGHNHSKH